MQPTSPLTLHWDEAELNQQAGTEDPINCVEWCIARGILPDLAQCPHDGGRRRLKTRAERQAVQWRCGTCERSVSAFTGSIFSESHLAIGTLITMLLCFARGYSYEQTKVACSRTEKKAISNVALTRWGTILHDMVARCVSKYPKIGGERSVVQIDEALLGRRNYHVGRRLTRTWVLGMVDSAGKIKLEVCATRNSATLHRLMRKYARVGSTIHTDEWRAYRGLEQYGYNHATVNHSRRFVSSGVHTQRIESAWRWIRRTVRDKTFVADDELDQ